MMTLGKVIVARDPKEFDEAHEQMLRGIAVLDELRKKPGYAMGLLHLGEFYTDAGQREEAIENLKKAEVLFQEMGMDYPLTTTRGILARPAV